MEFLNLLKIYKEKGCIKILHRGESKSFAFNCLNLDPRLNDMDEFAESFYFFGSKSKYFWNKKLNPEKDMDFDINDLSESFFEYIFHEFTELIRYGTKVGTSMFFDRNKEPKKNFSQTLNVKPFIEKINQLSSSDKFYVRNYYLRILHQLGESNYKTNSQFVSGSIIEYEAEKFSNNEIMIHFWDLDFNKQKLPIGIPTFKGKPYRNQKEISVFSAIFPQFIYSFKYKHKTYPNPAILHSNNLELAVLCGLEINQDYFAHRLKNETNYDKGVETDGGKYWEIE